MDQHSTFSSQQMVLYCCTYFDGHEFGYKSIDCSTTQVRSNLLFCRQYLSRRKKNDALLASEMEGNNSNWIAHGTRQPVWSESEALNRGLNTRIVFFVEVYHITSYFVEWPAFEPCSEFTNPMKYRRRESTTQQIRQYRHHKLVPELIVESMWCGRLTNWLLTLKYKTKNKLIAF